MYQGLILMVDIATNYCSKERDASQSSNYSKDVLLNDKRHLENDGDASQTLFFSDDERALESRKKD